MRDDRSYFRRREAEEIAAAKQATHPGARAAHVEMAELYRARADALAGREADTAEPAAGEPAAAA